MKNKKTKIIIVISAVITLAILLILFLQNHENLTKKQNQQLANVGNTTKIGDKTFNISNQIENDIIPTLSAGMIPLKEDGEYWVITDREDITWCNYANGRPAYMMLNDGKYQSEEYYQMPDTEEVAKAGTQINKESEDLGSIYMWVPRYAYNETGDIIYIKQTASIAGTWKMPNIFTYSTDKEDYALAGIWVECKSNEKEALANKIEQMNTEDSLYGFISNTKAVIMTEDKQETIQMLVEKMNKSRIENIENINHSIIYTINTNILEPIQVIGTLNSEAGKIEISIKHSTNAIETVLDGDGNELTLQDEKYTQPIETTTLPYIAIDKEGNFKEVEFYNLFIIDNIEKLCEFRDEVNNGNDFEDIKVVQIVDIDMSSVCGKSVDTNGDGIGDKEISWEPIGTGNVYFSGTYDGTYHTISNLYINTDKYDELGMFKQINEKAKIKGIVLENLYIKNYNNSVNYGVAAGIAGICRGVIEQCGIESGSIICTCSNSIVSGISDLNKYAEINQCYNKANLSASGSYAYAQGISSRGKVTDCYNRGTLTSSGNYTYTGGIMSSADYAVEIINCYNTGDMTQGFRHGGIIAESWNNSNIMVSNSYCLSDATYGAVQVSNETLKTYATEDKLGSAYTKDDYEINNGYPILKWELNRYKIMAKAYANNNEKKIIVEILNSKNKIAKVENEKGELLEKISDTIYKETLSLGNHKYKITDIEGNIKIIEFKLKEKLNVIYNINTKQVEITTVYDSIISEGINQDGNIMTINDGKAYGTLGSTASKYTITDKDGNLIASELTGIKINNEVLKYNKIAIVGSGKTHTTVKQGLDYLVDSGYIQNVALLLMEGSYDTADVHNGNSYNINSKYNEMDVSIIADKPGEVKCTSGEMGMTEINLSYGICTKFYGIVFTEKVYSDGEGGMDLNHDNEIKEYYNCVFLAATGGVNYNIQNTEVNIYNCLFLGGAGAYYTRYPLNGYAENCASKDEVMDPYSGTKVSPLYNVTVDSEYRITSDGWQNTGVGTNPDGSQANIGVYGGKFAWNNIKINSNLENKTITIDLTEDFVYNPVCVRYENKYGIMTERQFSNKIVLITDATEEGEIVLHLVTSDGRIIEIITGFEFKLDLHNINYAGDNRIIKNSDGSVTFDCETSGWKGKTTYVEDVDFKKYKKITITYSFQAGYDYGIGLGDTRSMAKYEKIVDSSNNHNSVPKTTVTANIPQDWDTVILIIGVSSLNAKVTIYDITLSM